MPLGIERESTINLRALFQLLVHRTNEEWNSGINVRRRHPNDRIVFIKPLEGPDKAVAQDFLERVAAIVVPVCTSTQLLKWR